MKNPPAVLGDIPNPAGRLSYKIPEAAKLLGVSTLTIRKAIDRGLLKPCRAFRHVLIPADQLNKLLNP